MTPAAGFAAALSRLFAGAPPARLGLAVSGGGDSVALLYLAVDWAAQERHPPVLEVATVDHRLRPEAAEEARQVAALCADLGLRHETLTWREDPPPGNLAAAARAARYELLTDWADRRQLASVLLGHTADDQAETVLMRLARGSGVDGLAAMSEGRFPGERFLRPLLGQRREALRQELRRRGARWIDDPTNDDLRYDRIKARRALEALAPLGLSVERLCDTAARMGRARRALALRAWELAEQIMRQDGRDLIFDAAPLWQADEETRLRLLAEGLSWVAGQAYRPRARSLERAVAAARSGRRATLHGAVLHPAKGRLRLHRELSAVEHVTCPIGELWDNRWRITPIDAGAHPDREVRALGRAGLELVEDWRAGDRPSDAAAALPAVWDGQRLICVPHLSHGQGYVAELAGPCPEFRDRLLSH